MSNDKDPLIPAGDSYFEGHPVGLEKQAQAAMAEREKGQLELERLCFEVFIASENGIKLRESLLERFVVPGLVSPQSQTFKQEVIYFEGFKEAFRGLFAMADNHQRRIAGVSK
jgi:hypothetical protein